MECHGILGEGYDKSGFYCQKDSGVNGCHSKEFAVEWRELSRY
jgi:hypothetical protein